MADVNTLNINPQLVCNLITKAKEFHSKEGVSFPETMPNSEYEYDSSQLLADHGDDMTFIEIKSLIEELEPDQQVDLLALMYLGRGDFEAQEWKEAQKIAKENLAPYLTEYLLSKSFIADHLESALDKLGYSCED